SSSPRTSPSALGSTPLAMGAGVFACPWPEGAGYASTRTYYPPNHPAPPAKSVAPSRCFSSAVEARLAGYQPATTPAGYLLAGGVYFERAGPAVATQCTKAAQELQTAVPCPTLVPTSWPGSRGLTCPPYGGFGPSPSTCTDGRLFGMSQGRIYPPPDRYPPASPARDLLPVPHGR